MEEFEDGLKIPGGQKLHGAEIDSRGDHRIAMAFAVAALRADGDTEIRGADAAVISYPRIFRRAGKYPGTVVMSLRDRATLRGGIAEGAIACTRRASC